MKQAVGKRCVLMNNSSSGGHLSFIGRRSAKVGQVDTFVSTSPGFAASYVLGSETTFIAIAAVL